MNAWIGVQAARSCLVIRNRDLEVSRKILASCGAASYKPVGEERTLVPQRHPVAARGRDDLGPEICPGLGMERDLTLHLIKSIHDKTAI